MRAHHLVCGKDDSWKTTIGLGYWLVQYTSEANVCSISQECSSALAENQTVSDKEPLEGNNRKRDDR
jgi:hypothetical protein